MFAGAFSAGKSMLINALLGRELLYSAEGHATGTECQIAYAEPAQERVVLTFLSELEVQNQVQVLGEKLGIDSMDAKKAAMLLQDPALMSSLRDRCIAIIQQEGGESKSEKAKQASAFKLLLQGFTDNQKYIDKTTNRTLSMEQFDFKNLQEAASYSTSGCHEVHFLISNLLTD